MKLNYIIGICFFGVFSNILIAQIEKEIAPPFNIKTVCFVQGQQNATPVFRINEPFELQFDDLYGKESSYFYEIIHCDYNWFPTDIPKSNYITNFDNLKIQNTSNSFNTLQSYTHYKLSFPNEYTRFLISGNYSIRILNSYGEMVFSRHFIIYEDIAGVSVNIRRSRLSNNRDDKQVSEISIKIDENTYINPIKNLKINVFKNGILNNSIKNLPPQYMIGNNLVYKYDKELQFFAGNEFLYFDNKDIRVANNAISRVNNNSDLYGTFLYTNDARRNFSYSSSQDVNGLFVVRNINSQNPEIEADYAWVYFSLSAPGFMLNKSIYVLGMFNNYTISEEYKMTLNKENNLYEASILIKQGFTSFQYVITDSKGIIDDENAIDGNFWQTENDYDVVVYYRADNSRYDRVIGKGRGNSRNISN